MRDHIRLGTRGSQLAIYQTNLVKKLIERSFPSIRIETVPITTSGDESSRRNVNPYGTKRVFTKEIEEALLSSQIDIAVHSAKDMAAVLPEGLKISAVLAREDTRDCLLSESGKKLEELSKGARLGTSSLRRKRQALRWNPGLETLDIRGNVETRIHKMLSGKYDAIILAYAGLKRVHLTEKVVEVLPAEKFYPSPGQGTIIAETREDDKDMEEILKAVHDEKSALFLSCERSFLKRLEGGCQLPCGIWTREENGTLKAGASLFDLDEAVWIEKSGQGRLEEAETLGEGLAQQILDSGGKRIIEKIREGDF